MAETPAGTGQLYVQLGLMGREGPTVKYVTSTFSAGQGQWRGLRVLSGQWAVALQVEEGEIVAGVVVRVLSGGTGEECSMLTAGYRRGSDAFL